MGKEWMLWIVKRSIKKGKGARIMFVDFRICFTRENGYHFDHPGVAICVFEELFSSNPRLFSKDLENALALKMEIVLEKRVADLPSMYASTFGVQKGDQLFFKVAKPALLLDSQIFYLKDNEMSFENLGSLLDLNGAILLLVISGDAGEYFHGKYPGFTFTLRTRERNHHLPHIHVDYKHERSGSLGIDDGEAIEGNLRAAEIRVAKKAILEHKELLLEAWNLSKAGIVQDIGLALENKFVGPMK